MPSTKEIRGKIKSVQSTRKITKAMEMVAASKMRKAQERMRAARPYADKIRNNTAHLSEANPEYMSPYLRDSAKTGSAALAVGFIVVTTVKGLTKAQAADALVEANPGLVAGVGNLAIKLAELEKAEEGKG
jgi:ATP synthase F1 gamma subunit